MKKKILLVDTNFSAKPIFDYLVSTGAEVHVMGGRPSDALAKSADNYIHLDYSKIDEVRSIIRRMDFEYIVPGGNDFSYRVCSLINEDLAYPSIDPPDVYEAVNNKDTFRRLTTELALHAPRHIEQDDIGDNLPVIIKPADAYSGHGMTVIREYNQKKIDDAIGYAKEYSKSDSHLIENFVEGQLYSHSAFLVDGSIMVDFIVEEHCTVNPYVVDTSRVVYDFNTTLLTQIREDITILAGRLSLRDGVVHTQFISGGSGFSIIEVTRRCPGDLYSMLIEYSTGFPYGEFYARPFINETKKEYTAELKQSLVMRHTITSPAPRAFHAVSFNHPVNIIRYVPLSLTGDRIKESPFSRIGIVFCSAESDEAFSFLFDATTAGGLISIE